MTEYKLFPGCVIQNRLPFIEASSKFVFDQLGLEYSAGEFGCCPNPVGLKFVDEKTWAALAARNICEAEKESKPIMSLCNGCYQSMAVAKHDIDHDSHLKTEVNEILSNIGKKYSGTSDINHFVHVLIEKVGVDAIKAKITRPLTGLKVAGHPGCHYARPSHKLHSEDPFHPVYLHQLIEATGASVIEYDQEMLCCGNSVRIEDP